MDRKIANNIVLGSFVLLGFVGFVFLLFNIGGGSGFFTSEFSLFARFSDVKGLHYGSEVSLAGLRIGVVTGIEVSNGDSKELVVEMSISKSVQDRIREDSEAIIRTQGVLGDKYIEITIGSMGASVLESGATIQAKEEGDLFSKGGSLVDGLKHHFQKGGNVEKLLKNLSSTAANLNTITGDIKKNQGGKSLGGSFRHLEGILRKIDKGEGTLGALVNDPTLWEDLKSLMGGAKRSSILKYFIRQYVDEGKKEEKASPKK